ncbi:MAG TPA: hypothetical protein VKD28_19100 [Gemmatimonadales bacterium]|nr:hypothetical protein [Gemmatimonadales bacterium]
MLVDPSFAIDSDGLLRALRLLGQRELTSDAEIPGELPVLGIGDVPAIELLAPHVLGKAARLGAPHALSHMDPPTPWITWALAMWNASVNQNLLHPATAPFARKAEEMVVRWLAPFFEMEGGHMTPGSTLANLTS